MQSRRQVVEDHPVEGRRASVAGEGIALYAADLHSILVVDVVEEIEQAVGGELRVQEHAQQPALGTQQVYAVQRRRHRHAELQHRLRDNPAVLDQAHPAGALGNQQVAGRQNRQAPGNLQALGQDLHVQRNLARWARLALHQLARRGFGRHRSRFVDCNRFGLSPGRGGPLGSFHGRCRNDRCRSGLGSFSGFGLDSPGGGRNVGGLDGGLDAGTGKRQKRRDSKRQRQETGDNNSHSSSST